MSAHALAEASNQRITLEYDNGEESVSRTVKVAKKEALLVSLPWAVTLFKAQFPTTYENFDDPRNRLIGFLSNGDRVAITSDVLFRELFPRIHRMSLEIATRV